MRGHVIGDVTYTVPEPVIPGPRLSEEEENVSIIRSLQRMEGVLPILEPLTTKSGLVPQRAWAKS